MSVTSPLLKDLKGWTRKLTELHTEITDKNLNLIFFCECLEKCFQQGIIARSIDACWIWLEELGKRKDQFLFAYSSAVEKVVENAKVNTSVGKIRLLIRTCLVAKCLHMPVQLLVRSPGGISLENYDASSILGDEILGEIFLSVLLQIGKLHFKLNLKNARFLDDSWQLPDYRSIELVPCKQLGVSVCFVKGKTLIVDVQTNSVAAEDGKVEVGDILDEINNEMLITSSRGKLGKILKKSSGLPITLHIIKHRVASTGEIYGPIVPLFKRCGRAERLKKILNSPEKKLSIINNRTDVEPSADGIIIKDGFHIKYCGSISTGTEGDVKQIEGAISRLINSLQLKSTPVRFECMEIGIKITDKSDGTIILQHSYMEISSCGRTCKIPNYFAFISGDTNCSIATKFEAHVFHHVQENEVQIILTSLAQGFHRTHFAV